MRRIKVDRAKVTVKFGGAVDGVDINTFTRTVLGYASAVQAAGGEVDASQALDIMIGQTRPGCLEVDLNLVADTIRGLIDFAAASAPVLPQIIEIATELYKLLAFLGKNGKEETATIESGRNRVVIKAVNASQITVNQNTYNIYTGRPDVAKAVVGSFKELDQHPEIESIEIGGEGADSPHFKVGRAEFASIASAPLSETNDVKSVVETDQLLSISRVILKESTKSMWRFVWNGVPISANISDEEFFGHFSEFSFGIGDVLVADLRITKRYDRELNAYMNERYEVVKVHDKRTAPKSQRII